jgi:NAD(P)-dependent dehydrogenase (short-subunit alcohol dehydrogenase family)
MVLSTSPRGLRVLVTGATGGIGRAIVETLTACGCTIGHEQPVTRAVLESFQPGGRGSPWR